MRKLVVAVFALSSFSFAAFADEHLDHLRMIMAAMSSHGPVIPQPEAITADAIQTINIIAKRFSFTPSSFTVNQGDVVTIKVSVPSSDGSSIGHGLLMDTYITEGLDVSRGGTESKTFTATMAGTFAFVCTKPNCDSGSGGHSNMFGTMIVNAVTLSVSDVSPTAGTIAGGTQITITGVGFDSSTTVTVGGVAATNVNVVNSTTIRATTPAHAAGTVDVVVMVGPNSVPKSGFLFFDPTPGKRRRTAKH
jgi:plastocyanin